MRSEAYLREQIQKVQTVLPILSWLNSKEDQYLSALLDAEDCIEFAVDLEQVLRRFDEDRIRLRVMEAQLLLTEQEKDLVERGWATV